MLILDTDVMVDLLRGYPPAIAWLESLGEAEIGLPGFVIMELIQGCRNKQEQKTLQQKIAPFEVLWPKPGDCDQALATFARLYLSSNLGILDVLIAYTALSLDKSIYTFNTKHYQSIRGLKTIQPYSRNKGSETKEE